ncbi:MAG: hypothetical protein SFV18_08760 [Bryobacteraceae bacterium]|nr:hypothetical protein [Bryobacteraceae bacterium]
MPLLTSALWLALDPLAAAGLPAGEIDRVTGASGEVRATRERVTVRRIVDTRWPEAGIFWQKPVEIARYELPADARIFARERWTGAPVMAGWKRNGRPVLWTATGWGERGYDRYPYLPQAAFDLGLRPAAEARDLWAFFDSSYRLRADPDYLAQRWRAGGIAAIHVAAWHYDEPDADRDERLASLIAACHRNAVLVYAWLELPHVSEEFWNLRPECREKTALGADAHLDWRRLINLENRACAAEVESRVESLLERFDWDGVNLAELYFESPEGPGNPARFTPMSADVRREFGKSAGVDPIDLFAPGKANAGLLRRFLDYRAKLAQRMQSHWLDVVARRPGLDIALTHVDDRFDRSMRDALGADAAAALPLLDRRDFTFLIEDPATVWHLGPQRYPEIAARYRELTPHHSRLGVDINVVERYQDVYPTKRQTGAELFSLVHLASQAFARVALYFENSILAPDWPLLAASAAHATVTRTGDGLRVESARDVCIRWDGAAKVNGAEWPLTDGRYVRLPAGTHTVEAGKRLPLRVIDLNAVPVGAAADESGVEIEYESRGRGIVMLSDGRIERLAAGRHKVYFAAATTGGS